MAVTFTEKVAWRILPQDVKDMIVGSDCAEFTAQQSIQGDERVDERAGQEGHGWMFSNHHAGVIAW